MNILLWIIFGGLAGWIATLILDVDFAYGIIGNIVIGIIGAFIGGYIADALQGRSGQAGTERPTSLWSFVWAVLGAVALLFILSLFF